MNEIKRGTKVELEHYNTIKKMMDGKNLSVNEAARMIALDHIKEHPGYYKKLARAGL